MAQRLNHLFDRFLFRRTLRRWNVLAETASAMDLETLRHTRGRAWSLRRHLDRVIHEADHRLALPVIGSNAINRPVGSDWVWRPMLWKGPIAVPGLASVPSKAPIGEGATVFHDCRRSELTVRQIRNTREEDLAPFGLRMDVFRFDGSFLSLVIDLPPEAVDGLKTRHLIRLDAIVEMEKPLEIFARLNIRHGPNVEQVLRELPLAAEEVMVEFDLAYTRMNEKRVEQLWIDLIFEGPEMNQIILRDVTLSRRPRPAFEGPCDGEAGMTELVLTPTRIRAGVWEGVLSGAAPGTAPQVEVTHLGAAVPGVSLLPVPSRPGEHELRVPIPAEALFEGVQTFLIRSVETGATLGHFTVVTGVALEGDIRAEMDLLRAELDMLKRAFRRHCLETMG